MQANDSVFVHTQVDIVGVDKKYSVDFDFNSLEESQHTAIYYACPHEVIHFSSYYHLIYKELKITAEHINTQYF